MTDVSSINERLRLLPRKISIPFQELLDRGYLTDEVMATILDAGDIAVDKSKLLGFAIGYSNLRQSGVPMRDVIKMSKSLGRTIRLDWSINRWRAEHDRLSRAESLTKLAGESATYDLSKFEQYLPARFPGYLIRTSRRLGMEGLRQRHCVASYHRQLMNGYCALAVVFVNKKRWTVQLSLFENSDRPLRISQIRTRLNAVPSSSERTMIHQHLGIDDGPPSADSAPGLHRPLRRSSWINNLQRILPVLRARQVDNVAVYFDGSGDSGSIDCIGYKPEGFDGSGILVIVARADRTFEDGQWIMTEVETQVELDEAISEITYDYLDSVGADWQNNDGGYGELIIEVDPGTVSMEVNTRRTESDLAHYALTDIESGEEIE